MCIPPRQASFDCCIRLHRRVLNLYEAGDSSETGRIQFGRVRFPRAPNSVSSVAFTEFRAESSVSALRLLSVCQSELTKFLAELGEFGAELGECSLSLSKQKKKKKKHSRNSIPPVSWRHDRTIGPSSSFTLAPCLLVPARTRCPCTIGCQRLERSLKSPQNRADFSWDPWVPPTLSVRTFCRPGRYACESSDPMHVPMGAWNRCHLSNWRVNPETAHFWGPDIALLTDFDMYQVERVQTLPSTAFGSILVCLSRRLAFPQHARESEKDILLCQMLEKWPFWRSPKMHRLRVKTPIWQMVPISHIYPPHTPLSFVVFISSLLGKYREKVPKPQNSVASAFLGKCKQINLVIWIWGWGLNVRWNVHEDFGCYSFLWRHACRTKLPPNTL